VNRPNDQATVLAGYLKGDPANPNDARGDFVVGRHGASDGWAQSATVGASPWYYTVTAKGELFQGANVFDLCRDAKLKWDWNFLAIRQIATVGHTLGGETLHTKIHRLPSRTKLALVNGSALLQDLGSLAAWEWDKTELDLSFRSLSSAFERCLDTSREPILSLSAGYDSRLLLALCLRFGCSPTLVTMGASVASDVKVAAILARQVGLPGERIDVVGADYVKHGEEISHTTSGVKTAGDWHTWLYNKNIGVSDRVHLVGSNGEFARTFYSDTITRSAAFRRTGRAGAAWYFRARALNRARKFSQATSIPSLAGLSSVLGSLHLPTQRYPAIAVAALDTFYATERVRHFIGSGLACYGQFSRPRSPFLDLDWMKPIAALRRDIKEQNRYHLAAIKHFAPALLDVPFNRDPDGGASVTYSPFSALSASKDLEELLIESAPLDFLLDRNSRMKSLSAAGAQRVNLVSLLLTMHFASLNAAKVHDTRRATT
jgi:hypothetical protein